MIEWTDKRINELRAAGKIRGFSSGKKVKKPKTTAKKPRTIKKRSEALVFLDMVLPELCAGMKLEMITEHVFDDTRKWRFDYAIRSLRIAIEFEGGIFLKTSGHNTAKHYTKDTEKYNRAVVLGWRVLRFTAMNYKDAPGILTELIKQTIYTSR